MRPVVDPGKEESEEDEAHDPPHRLAVDLFPIEAPPALPVVEDRTDQAADGSGGADGERDAGQIGEVKACNAGPEVEDGEAMESEFFQDERGELIERHHVEEEVKKPSVEEGGGDERPPTPVGGDGQSSRCAEEKKAPIRGGKKGHRVGRKAEGRRIQKERKEVERDVDCDDRFYRINPEQGKTAEESPFPERTWTGRPTIGT